MAKKVFIGVGHGGRDFGAVKYAVEKDLNLVQLGAFKNRKNAEVLVKELKVKGYQAIIKEQR